MSEVKWLVKTIGNNRGKIYGYNPILAKRADMLPYDGPIDEKGYAKGYRNEAAAILQESVTADVPEPDLPTDGKVDMSPKPPTAFDSLSADERKEKIIEALDSMDPALIPAKSGMPKLSLIRDHVQGDVSPDELRAAVTARKERKRINEDDTV